MAERPLLLLPRSTAAERAKKSSGGGGPANVSAQRQQERLGPRLKELEQAFASKRVELKTETTGVVAEDVLVLETAGTVEEFVNAVRRIPGFDFLAEYDEQDIAPDDDFFVVKKGEHASYTGRVYLAFANQDAFKQLQRLWALFQSGGTFEHGLTRWRDVFALLRDIRPWGVKDRLEETGVLTEWEERVSYGEQSAYVEIELWFRSTEQQRSAAASAVRTRVTTLGGDILGESVVEGIRYHGLSVRLPIGAVAQVLDLKTRQQVELVRSEQIQFFRAAGQTIAPAPGDRTPSTREFSGALPAVTPRVALLDGLPLQNHGALSQRLRVDDPDGFGTGYQVDARHHGTAMASLIIWGDLNRASSTPIPTQLYVRPIMRPDPAVANQQFVERVPQGTMVVDIVYRAVRRLFERDGQVDAAAPDVAIVNFSIGIADRPFAGTLSPLARLLDWLSWTYKVLFIVSAGNHLHDVETRTPWSTLEAHDDDARASVILQSLASDSRNRRALSPAEAMNVLTVGALHSDDDRSIHPQGRFHAVPTGYPSPLNAHGLGYRRSIKPDLLVSGGRLQFLRPMTDGETRLSMVRVAASPGLQVAAPGEQPGDTSHTAKSRGTSNAAALLSRAGAFLMPVLAMLRDGDDGAVLEGVSDAVLVKALLAHGARWGSNGDALHRHFAAIADSDKRTDQLTRLLGFGGLEIADIGECTPLRVTAIAAGTLAAEEGAEHRFPLPPSVSGKRGWRRLTVTLAWFSPVNPTSHKWREAQLWFEKPVSKLKVKRLGPDWQTAQRGTLQHNSFEGKAAAAFVDGDDIVIRVSCRQDAPGLKESVPYALAITLEVAEDIGVDVYAEVRERVRQRQQVSRVTTA